MQDLASIGAGMDQQLDRDDPIVTFYRFVPESRPPMRGDRSAAGTMPMRAYRHCEAMTSASAFGWYIFPPITFSLLWDGGTEILCRFKGQDAWFPLSKIQFPGFAERFDAAAPADIKSFSPSFLAPFRLPGGVQIWSGLVARTAPGWSLLIRQPVNLQRSLGYESYEGIIETDRWFGPLFTNIRLTRTNVPIEFSDEYPFLQVQPVYRGAYGKALDNFAVVPELGQLTPEDWQAFRATVVQPNVDPDRQIGQYGVDTRRRRKQSAPRDTVKPGATRRAGANRAKSTDAMNG